MNETVGAALPVSGVITNWPPVSPPNSMITLAGGLFSDSYGVYGSDYILFPPALSPTTIAKPSDPEYGSLVQTQAQSYYVGSTTTGVGTPVRRQFLQFYRGWAAPTEEVTP